MSPLPVGPPGRSANIFINYRREDSAGHAGRLFDGLSSHFPGRLFMDIDTIAPGVDFIDAIEKAVGSCEVLIVVIGREWLASKNAAGQRRLDDPDDFVRLELETALARDIRVIPVLVQGTPMPRPADLPPSLARLARRNAIELSDARWAYDVNRLAQTIQGILGEETAAPPAPADPPPQVLPSPAPAGRTARPRTGLFLLVALVLFSAVVVASAGWMSRRDRVAPDEAAAEHDASPAQRPASEPPPAIAKTPVSPEHGRIATAPSGPAAAQKASSGPETAPAQPPRPAPAPRRQEEVPKPASPPPSAAPVPSPVTAVVEEAPAPPQQAPQRTTPQQTSPAPVKPAPAQETPAGPEIPAQGSEPPAEDLSRLASELSAAGDRLVELYATFLKQKGDAGWVLTASDDKLQEELEAFAEAAEEFNDRFKKGFFARNRDRWLKIDQRTDVLNRFKNLDAAGKRVNSLMAEVQPSAEVRQEWKEVLELWKRVFQMLSSSS